MKQLSKEHFQKILRDVTDQVFEGKGKERHGHGNDFEDQPWKHIVDNVGPNFLLGQGLKKALELRSFDNIGQKKKEAIGAIAYLIMYIMYCEYQEPKF